MSKKPKMVNEVDHPVNTRFLISCDKKPRYGVSEFTVKEWSPSGHVLLEGLNGKGKWHPAGETIYVHDVLSGGGGTCKLP